MLVLTRKSNQSIMIGDEIEVSVLAVSGDKVRLGIEAPKAVPVFRTEVWLEMQEEEAAAAAEGSRTQAESVDEALHRLSSGE
ncbi:MAG TPA: carbon storage regulator CsrA [Thermoleophilaceae bacterium]|nr:carbon storage regulator CsrA [Thermoleophilaceae bacterium]